MPTSHQIDGAKPAFAQCVSWKPGAASVKHTSVSSVRAVEVQGDVAIPRQELEVEQRLAVSCGLGKGRVPPRMSRSRRLRC